MAWTWSCVAVAATALLVTGGLLLTRDVHAEDPRDGESTPAFCGSAHDVLVRGHGDMGGEPVGNQPALDLQCVRRSGRLVALGSATAGAGLTLGVAVLVALLRAAPRRGPAPQE